MEIKIVFMQYASLNDLLSLKLAINLSMQFWWVKVQIDMTYYVQ